MYTYTIEVRLWWTGEKPGSFGGLWYVLVSLGRTHSPACVQSVQHCSQFMFVICDGG